MEGAVKAAELMLSLAEMGGCSRGREGFSFPCGPMAPDSVLGAWRRGCATTPRGGCEAPGVAAAWCTGEPRLRAALPPLIPAAEMGLTPAGFASGAKSCFLTEEGVGPLGCGL
jgi:hypothetical protein